MMPDGQVRFMSGRLTTVARGWLSTGAIWHNAYGQIEAVFAIIN